MTSLTPGESQMGAEPNQTETPGEQTVDGIGYTKQLVFVGMAILAMTTMVIGMTLKKSQPLQWMFFVSWVSWMAMTAWFILLYKEKLQDLHLCLRYLICEGMILFFLCTMLRVPSDAIPTYFPIVTNVGIFLGYATQELWYSCCSGATRYTRKAVEVFCDVALNVLNGIMGVIPQHRRSPLDRGIP